MARIPGSAIGRPYAKLWDQFDAVCHIKAPGFGCVRRWREEQERSNLGLGKRPLSAQRAQWVQRFIWHFERLTCRLLSGGHVPGLTVHVDETRKVISRPAAY